MNDILVDFLCPVIPPASATNFHMLARPFPFAASRVDRLVSMVGRRPTSGHLLDVDKIPEECEAVAHLATLAVPTLQILVNHLDQQFEVSFSLACLGHFLIMTMSGHRSSSGAAYHSDQVLRAWSRV